MLVRLENGMEMLNKDFYRNLPGMVPPILEDLIRRYRKEEWFEKAWNEYRHHILSSSMDEMKMPGFVFKKYIKDSSVKHSDDPNKFGVPEQKKFPLPDADHVRSAIKFFNYVQPEYEKELAKAILQKAKEYNVDLSEMSIGDNNRFKKYVPKNELMHFGILGQKWGVRRFQNEDGTLTDEGRVRYSRQDKQDAKKIKKEFNNTRLSSVDMLKGKKSNIGSNQKEVLARYKKEALNTQEEKMLNQLDKEKLDIANRSKKAIADYRANPTKENENRIMKIYEEAQLHQKQYDNLVRQNTIKGQEIAKKYIGEMNKALAKDLGYSDISRGADYLTEHGGGWDHIYISNMAWFDQKF